MRDLLFRAQKLPALAHISREADAYDALYSGKTLLLKVSGSEIESEDFPKLIEDIRFLLQKGIKIILVYGGGEQINRHYGKPRIKLGGVGVTDSDVLWQGVLPANAEIKEKLREALPEGIYYDSYELPCDPHPESNLGNVGVPQGMILSDESLHVLGFVGDIGGKPANVNADDIAHVIAEHFGEDIEEAIFLTNTGGVLAEDASVVTLLTQKRIRAVLEGEDSTVKVDGGMRKKLKSVEDMLPLVGKIVITKTDGLRDEVEQWKGSGTLCLDSTIAEAGAMLALEEPIFDAIFAELVSKGVFRERTEDEIRKLKAHHRMLRVKSSPLGGFSLIPHGEWLELCTLWAGTVGNGVGQLLLESAIKEANGRKLFALTTDDRAAKAFEANGFESLGLLSEALQNSAELPAHLKDYDTSKRDPKLFLSL